MDPFAHLALINEAIYTLYTGLKPAIVEKYKDIFVFEDSEADVRADPILGTRRLVRGMANHLDLSLATVVLTFVENLKVAGRVELSPSLEFFVDVHSGLIREPKAIAAVLAHEMLHVFLHRRGINIPDNTKNEILTDTAAAYLDFGAILLNAATTTLMHGSRNEIQTVNLHLGYVTPNELGFILAKRDFFFAVDSSKWIDDGLPLKSFVSGREQLQQLLKEPPFVKPPVAVRVIRTFLPAIGYSSKLVEPIVFACPCCNQQTRIPVLKKKLLVRCRTCEHEFVCYSW